MFPTSAAHLLMGHWGTGEMRSRVVRQTRRPDLAFRLIPEHTGDSSYAARAKILFGSLFQDIPADSILPKVIHGAAFKSIAIHF